MTDEQPEPSEPNDGVILPSSPSFVTVPREIEIYAITQPELDALVSFYNSIHIVMFGLAAGALIAFWITLITVDDLGVRIQAAFIALTAVSAVSTLYFLIRTIIDLRTATKRIDIRNRTVR